MLNWKLVKQNPLELSLKYRKVSLWEYRMPDGSQHSFEINQVGGVVCVCALDAQENLVLVEQFRPGPQKVMLELVAGLVDPNEQPLEAARRELLEETGYTGDFKYVGKVYPDAYSDVVRHIYLTQNCHKIQEPQLEESEFLHTKILSIPEYEKYLLQGHSTNIAAFYLCLKFLQTLSG